MPAMNQNPPRTIAGLLGTSGDTLQQSLHQHDVTRTALAGMAGLASAVYPLADERVAETLHGLLEIDLGGLLVAGWCRYRALITAAEATRAAPGTTEDVALVEHEVTSEHHPQVEVLIDGHHVTTLTFDVTVTLTLQSISAVVADGRLTHLRAGTVGVGAALSYSGQPLLARDMTCLVGALVPLARPIELVQPAPAAAQPATARPAAAQPAAEANRPWWQRT